MKLKTYNERLEFYLGENLIKGDLERDITKYDTLSTFDNLRANEPIYENALRQLLIKTNNTNKYFCFKKGDISNPVNEVTLVKNRCAENNNSVILRCLEFGRHWNLYYQKPKDRWFFQKKKQSILEGNIHWKPVPPRKSVSFGKTMGQ